MSEQVQPEDGKVQDNKNQDPTQQVQRPWWIKGIVIAVAVLMTGVIVAPLSLSTGHIVHWALQALGVGHVGAGLVAYALDGTAMVCVLILFWRAWQGYSGGIWAVLIWVLSGLSAWAQYRQGLRDVGAAPDAYWFFPAMALSAPFLLECVLRELRRWMNRIYKRAAKTRPVFDLSEWLPLVGSFKDTYGAWRTARLLDIEERAEAIATYRDLCPDGSIKVLTAIRARHQVQAVQVQDSPVLSEKVQVQPPVQDNKTVQVAVQKQEVQVQPVQDSVRTEDRTVQDLYENPIKEQSSSKSRTTNDEYLAMIAKEFPGEIPTGNQIRTKLGVNYQKSKTLLELLEKDNKHGD